MNIETEVAVMQKRVEHLESNYQQLKEEHNGAMATLRGIDRQLAQIK